jgi:uncharacterized protein with PQ loop repeat
MYLPIFSSLILMFSFLPLVKKIRKNRSVSGLSLWMMSFGVAQSSYFIAYNVYFDRLFMMLPFLVTGILSALILYYFVRYNACSKQRRQLTVILCVSVFPFLLLLTPFVAAAQLFTWLTFVGLIMSSLRVIPQTFKTIKSKDVANLSAGYFSLQFLAGVVGLSAELNMTQISVAHLMTFIMILLTNAAQLGCISYYRRCPAVA